MWQYITRIQIDRTDSHGTRAVWLPITWRGKAGRILNRQQITDEALRRGGQFLGQIAEYETKRGRTDALTGSVQIIGVVWIPK